MRHLLTSNAFRFCMAVNCVVISSWFVIDSFNASPFAEVEDWGAFILFMLTLGRGGGMKSDLQKLRCYHFVIFLVFAFGAPIGLSAFLVAISSLFAFVEAHFSAYAPAIYAWLIWFGLCLVTVIHSYWEDKRGMGA